jgi:hypothetical protein
MGQGTCGRTAAALTISLLGLSPAFAMDWVEPPAIADPNSGGVLFARPCPTRFDYLVLASFADAPSLLSLSTYHFRSEAGFSAIAPTGVLQVDYKLDSRALDCRSRVPAGRSADPGIDSRRPA